MRLLGRLLLLTLVAGLVGGWRQRREAAAVRDGRLDRVGPTGSIPPPRWGERPDPLHAAVARWTPTRPTTAVGRALATLWVAPLTAVGLLGAAAAGSVPRWDHTHGCLVAARGRGLTGALLKGQGAAAATLGQVVLAHKETVEGVLLAHEVAHVRQQERLGPVFAVAYVAAQAGWGYRNNPFEVAARRIAALSAPTGSA